MCEKTQPENVESLPAPFKSVHGVGRKGPDHSRSLIHPEGVQIPTGPVINYKADESIKKQMAASNPAAAFGSVDPRLAHNEFVVYNTDQVKMRYLVQVCKKT